MRFWKFCGAAVICLLLVSVARADEIQVAAAASLKDVMTTIAGQYKAGGGDDVTFVFGSSGQLATQIQDGAPADLFISAANKQVDDLTKAGLVDPATRRVIAGNSLVLIVPAVAKDAPRSFSDLADTRYQKIALGDPKSVPAGDYAMQTLTALKIADKITDRVVYGTNVRQVLAYVEDGDVAAGIVYSTDAKQSGDKVRVVATAEEKMHEPIVYPAVVVKASKKQAAAKKFLEYLQSEGARKALTAQGFTIVSAAATPTAQTATAPAK